MAYFGPFTENISIPSTNPTFVSHRERYKQKAPYVDPLPYKMCRHNTYTIPNIWGLVTDYSWPGTATYYSPPSAVALSNAYGKFREEAKQNVNLAVNIAERKQSVDMIAKRASQIFRFAVHLKSLRFRQAALALGLEPISEKRHRTYTRMSIRHNAGIREVRLKHSLTSFGNNYLEFHFGWEPLVKDIGEGIDILHGPCFKGLGKKCTGRATVTSTAPAVPTLSDFSIKTVAYWPRVTVKLSAYVIINDPNLYRQNQMGFINPAVVAWELVPFSFVVDWFSNVGQVLEAYTDFIGLSLTRACTGISSDYEYTTYYRGRPPSNWYGRVTLPYSGGKGTSFIRTIGISMPSLVFKPPKWPSVTRALTSISLLSQFLRK